MIDKHDDVFELSTGRRFSRSGLLAVDADGVIRAFEVTHSGVEQIAIWEAGKLTEKLEDDNGKRFLLTNAERLEVAEIMIRRWQAVADDAKDWG